MRWPSVAVGKVCDVVNGGTPKTNVEAFWGGPHMWITPAEMGRRSSPYVSETERRLTDSGMNAANLLPPYSVILSSRAPIGHLVINTVPMATNQGCKGLVPKQGLDHKFLYYFLVKSGDLLNELGTGTTFKELSGGKLKKVEIPLPPLDEQRRIVAILDEAFEAIATATANAEKNLTNARELFGRYLNITFEKESYPRVPLERLLSEQPRNGWSPPAKYQTGNGNPVLTLSSVTGFEFDGSKVKLSTAPTTENARYWLKRGELLITRSNTQELVGHVAIYDGTPEPAICCDLIMKMMVDPKQADTLFVYYFLRSEAARKYFTTLAHGASSTMKKISKPMVQNILVPTPPRPEQTRIIAKLNHLRAQSGALEHYYQNKRVQLSELKRAILERAFSGNLAAIRPHALDAAAE